MKATDLELRLLVVRAALGGALNEKMAVRALAYEAGRSQRDVLAVAEQMESVGLPLYGGFTEVTTVQAAWLLGLIDRRIRDFCRTGRLGRVCGGRYIIPTQDLLRFAERPRPVGGAGVKALAELRAGKGE